ncbi:MAG: fluoride efflux transporter CrcB [Acidimicrobiales bacterium]
MHVPSALAVAAGGFLGAPTRYVFDHVVSARGRSDFPWGILIVNWSGALLFGLFTGLALDHVMGPAALALAGTGFCGAYTTFSSFSVETLRLLEKGELLETAANVIGSLVVGLLLAGAGLAAGLAL